MRIDFPLPLRTEDVAQLDPNGRFEIIGRIEKSPLKGCSLRVEEVVSAPSTVLAPSTHSLSSRADQNSFDFDKVTFVKRDILTRTKIIQTLLEDFCRNTETQNALARELGAKNAAITALKDTLECTPKKDSDWLTAVTTACGDDSLENPKHWLYILPNNHSLVGIYPLALAYVAGLDVTVRLPEKFASVDSLLQIFLRKLKPHMVNSQLTLEIKPSTFKLGKDPIPPSIGAVLCYGSDETIFAIKKICNIQVHGFGNRFTASVLNAAATQLDLKLQLAALVKDAFGLGQRGCLSTRVAFILNSKDLSSRALFQTFKDAFSSFWNAPLDSSVLLGHELESWRYKKMQAQNIDFANYDNSFPLMPIFKFDSVEEIPYDFIQKIVSRHPFVLPLVTITNTSCEENVKSVLDMIFDCNEVGQVSLGGFLEASQMLVKYRYRPRKLAPLGLANQLPWDGTHEGLPLFSLNKK
jgi:hypothetical protein